MILFFSGKWESFVTKYSLLKFTFFPLEKFHCKWNTAKKEPFDGSLISQTLFFLKKFGIKFNSQFWIFRDPPNTGNGYLKWPKSCCHQHTNEWNLLIMTHPLWTNKTHLNGHESIHFGHSMYQCCTGIQGTFIICTLVCIRICQNLFVGYVLKYILRLILESTVILCGHT